MQKLKVYISSTYMDMADAEIRDFLIDRIQNDLPEYFELTRIMEQMDGDSQNELDVNICLKNVRDADLYILLVGNRYGSYPDKYTDENGNVVLNENKYSYTELEYLAAEKKLETKFYGIYKFKISDDFFKNIGKNDYSDLGDSKQNDKYRAFEQRLNEGSSSIIINNEEELIKKVNNKLTEFYMYTNRMIQLKITDQNKMLINRETQKNIIDKKRNPDIFGDDIPLGQKSKSVVFVFNSTDVKDDFEKFGLRVKNEVLDTINSNTDLAKPEYISLSALLPQTLGPISDVVYSKVLQLMLSKCSVFLFDKSRNGCTFDNIDIDLRNQKSLNKFIYLSIDLQGNEDRDSFPIEIISQFIKKIETIINSIVGEDGRSAMSSDNLFYVLNLMNDDDKVYQKCNAKIVSSLPDIECIDLTKLKKVPADDVFVWLNDIIETKQLNIDVNEMYKYIFSDRQAEPRHYKEYIYLLEKKIKVWNI